MYHAIILLLISTFYVSDNSVKLSLHPSIIKMHKEAQKQRKKYNKTEELKLDEECCQMAQEWANHMAKHGKFHHGKNDQIISRGYKTIKATFRGWMNSSGHKAWILNSKSTKCGWGCQQSKGGKWYRVGVFRK